MTTMQRTSRFSLALQFCLLLAAAQMQAAQNDWTGGGNGDWTNAAHWGLSAAPGSTDSVTITNRTSTYTVTVDAGTPAGNLTISNLLLGSDAANPATTQTLAIVNTASPFVISNSTKPMTINYGGVLAISNSTVRLSQNGGGNSEILGRLVVGSNGFFQLLNAPSDSGIKVYAGGSASFQDATLVITNSGNAYLSVGDGTVNAKLSYVGMTNTFLRVNQLTLDAGARVHIDNTANTNLTVMRVYMGGGNSRTGTVLNLVGGRYSGSIALYNNAHFTNIGATISMSAGNIKVGRSANGGADNEVSDYVVIGGTNLLGGVFGGNSEVWLGHGNNGMTDGYGVTGRMHQVSGLLDANALNLGQISNSIGVFRMESGTVILTNFMTSGANARNALKVGSAFGKGLYSQEGGQLLAGEVQLGAGAEQFRVDAGATLTVIDSNGFVSAAALTTSNGFDLDGTLRFAPRAGVLTQKLTLAGLDLGASFAGFSNNFAIGNLDLGAFTAGNRLVLASFASQASTALYVRTLSAVATNALVSSFTVYYDAALNPGLSEQTYGLQGGGFLVPIVIPEPHAALALLLGGAVLLLRRSRR